MNAEQNRPPMDADPIFIIAHCLKWPVEYVEAMVFEMSELLPSPENHDWWDRRDAVPDAIPLARKLGLPHDPRLHQQPHDVGYMNRCVLPTHSDQADDDNEIFVNRMIYPLFIHRQSQLLDTLPRSDALEQIKWLATELNHFFGSNVWVTRKSRLQEATRVINWFRDTEGLHDPESGIVDVEAAALRAYLRGKR